jgi:glycosyltransferase involved in cell wall biosynthesis
VYILIICNSVSGLNNFRSMLIKELIKINNKVVAVIPTSEDEVEQEAKTELKKIGCKLISLPLDRRGINPIKDYSLFRGYYRILNKLKPDIVITYTIKPNIYGGLACQVKNIPYAVNITGLGTAFHKDRKLRKLVITMYKAALKRAKIVFFENIDDCDTMVKYGIIEKIRTHVLPGAGVDLERFTYTEYPEDSNETRFIYIGRVMKEKGIDELFAVMKRLYTDGMNCSLDLLGDFEEDYAEQLKKYEKEGWLRYHGRQSDVRPFIANAHCFVLPSWHEGMANTNLECAAMGRPIITSNIHGCLEAVIDGESGLLCERKDINSLYRVMKTFIEIPYAKKKQMGINGRRHVESIFDKKKVVAETIFKLKEEL